MSKNVNKTSMQELCEITSSKRVYAADYQYEGVPFYRGKEIIEKHRGNLDISTELFISENKFKEFKKKFGAPQPGDLLLTSVGTLGVPYVVKSGEVFYFKDGNLTWFRQFRNLDSHFLYYWILSPQGKAELKKCTIGSSQSAFTIVLLKDMEIELPPLPTQQKISSILAAYDDLIENNNRRIKILEEMAQAIYKEWFVNFRFPGYEKVKMVKSELGMISEGWEVKEMQEVANVIDCLHSKKPKEIENGNKFLLQLFNISEGGKLALSKKYYISDEDYELWTRRIEASEGDCVITNVGRIAAVAQIPQGIKAALGRNMTAVRANKKFITPSFLIQYLLSPHMESEVLKKTDRGTIMDSLNVKNIVKLSINIPTSEIMEKFDNAEKPIRRRIELLVNQNMILRKTRDLLLPKLISGEIDVEGLEIEINGTGGDI